MIKVGPFYDLVQIANNEGEGFDKDLKTAIKNLVDLTIFRTEKLGINEASYSLVNDFINFRLVIAQKQEIIAEYFENADKWLAESIVEQYEGKPTYVALESNYIQSLDLYKSILGPLTAQIDVSMFDGLPKINSIEQVFGLMQNIPSGSVLIQQFNQLFKTSAAFDYALLTSALLFDSKIKLTASERKLLTEMVRETAENYAVTLSLLGLWTPEDEDERQLVRNVKIKLSYVESLNMSQEEKRYSAKELNQVLTD